jgi:mycofactocin glycosyltransferase
VIGPPVTAPGWIAAPPERPRIPAGTLIAPDADFEIFGGGPDLVFAASGRLWSLRGQAAAVVRGWLRGEPVSQDPVDQDRARRLVSAGAFHPTTPVTSALDPSLLTVVIPVHERPEPLGRLLAALGAPGELGCIVVDDGSRQAESVRGAAERGGARYLRLPANRGPAAARNAGLRTATTPFVAFIDSDCLPSPGWLPPLLALFDDPLVAVAAPRIRAGVGGGWWARYEETRCALDLGSQPGLVGPRRRVSYVPSAALVVRRAALSDSCFDESMRGGEDVDFVWRIVAAGWEVRYVPLSTVEHDDERGALGSLGRRAFYGSTAGPLAVLHPDALAAVRLPPWMAVGAGLLLRRRPLAAATITIASGARLARRLAGQAETPGRTAARLTARTVWRGSPSIVTSAVRAFSPALAVGACTTRFRRLALWAFVLSAAADWFRGPKRLDPARYLAAHAADDLSYGAGLWWGCWRARTVRPLMVRFARAGDTAVRQPGSSSR